MTDPKKPLRRLEEKPDLLDRIAGKVPQQRRMKELKPDEATRIQPGDSPEVKRQKRRVNE